MASYYYLSSAPPGGDGSLSNPFNSLASRPTGAHTHYLIAGSVFYETFTFSSANSKLLSYGVGPPPVIDCQNTRATGINLNAQTGLEVAGICVINQNAALNDSAIRCSGSGSWIHHNIVLGCRNGICGPGASMTVEYNYIDVGNPLTPADGYGIRFTGVSSTGHKIRRNEIVATGAWRWDAPPPAVFAAAIELFNSDSNFIEYNTLHAAICDQILLKSGSDNNTIRRNLLYGTGMLDGVDIFECDTVLFENNVILHPGDVPTHEGPCIAIGDNFGVGTVSTNVTVKDNCFVALNRMCMSLRPNDVTNVYANNRYWAPLNPGLAIINYKAATVDPFDSLDYAEWMLLGLDTDSTAGDPLVDSIGRPLPGSPLLGAGSGTSYIRDFSGALARKFIGVFGAAAFRSAP